MDHIIAATKKGILSAVKKFTSNSTSLEVTFDTIINAHKRAIKEFGVAIQADPMMVLSSVKLSSIMEGLDVENLLCVTNEQRKEFEAKINKEINNERVILDKISMAAIKEIFIINDLRARLLADTGEGKSPEYVEKLKNLQSGALQIEALPEHQRPAAVYAMFNPPSIEEEVNMVQAPQQIVSITVDGVEQIIEPQAQPLPVMDPPSATSDMDKEFAEFKAWKANKKEKEEQAELLKRAEENVVQAEAALLKAKELLVKVKEQPKVEVDVVTETDWVKRVMNKMYE